MSQMNLACPIHSVSSFYDFRATVDVLRLDLVHPVVSGNKLFKLKEYFAEAKALNQYVLTFGGAYSNHIVATAAAASMQGLKSIGVIRGEKLPLLSHTLQAAIEYGMDLYFVNREAYRSKNIPTLVFDRYPAEKIYVIPEGGYGKKGVQGAKEILLANDTVAYTHVLCAVGTGTTLAGLVTAANEMQNVLGISVLNNHFSLEEEVGHLLPADKQKKFQLVHDYHFGGYAKRTDDLLSFMNRFYEQTGIPTDFVYTAKASYAAKDLLEKGFFKPEDKLLLVHTGGLQGNGSLPKGTLIFE